MTSENLIPIAVPSLCFGHSRKLLAAEAVLSGLKRSSVQSRRAHEQLTTDSNRTSVLLQTIVYGSDRLRNPESPFTLPVHGSLTTCGRAADNNFGRATRTRHR